MEKANAYLSGSLALAGATEVITRTVIFTATKNAKLLATICYENVNGRINLISISSQAIGDGAYTFKQKGYTTQRLDGGRSMVITIKGTLKKTIVVGGKIQKTNYSESIYIEI